MSIFYTRKSIRLLFFFSSPLISFPQRKVMVAGIFAVMMSATCFAQSNSWIWARNAGGIFNEARGEALATDASGNVIVAGSFSCPQLTFDNITVVNSGGDDIFLVKYDSSGNALWATSAGDDFADQCHSVATDASGNVYITGEFWSASITIGNVTLTNSGTDDIFIAKFDASGNPLWAKSTTGTNEDVSNDVTTDTFGNVYLVGSFLSGSISFGGITLTNTSVGFEDLFIAKLDSDGNTLWASNAIGTSRDQAFGIVADLGGNIYVTGNFRSNTITFDGVTISNSGGDDMFIVKYDPDGNAIWGDAGQGNGYDYGFSVATDAGSNAYITGHFGSSSILFGNTILNSSGGDDAFIVKYDSSGNVLWAHKGGGADYDYGLDIDVSADGTATIAGYDHSSVVSFGNEILTNTGGGFDFFLVRYDSSGNVLWAKNTGNSQSTFGYACAVDDSGNAYISGTFGDPSITLGNFTLTTSGGYDMYIAKYGLACDSIFYADSDGDQFGDPNSSILSCTAVAGYVTDSTDCDDHDAAINPLAPEIPNNGIDDDCDGLVDEFPTAIVALESDQPNLIIFPNPTEGNFTIEWNNHRNTAATIRIINQLGKVALTTVVPPSNHKHAGDGTVFQQEISPGSFSMAEGMYLVEVVLDDKVYSQQVIYLR